MEFPGGSDNYLTITGASHPFLSGAETFHTPSLGDEEFELPPIALDSDPSLAVVASFEELAEPGAAAPSPFPPAAAYGVAGLELPAGLLNMELESPMGSQFAPSAPVTIEVPLGALSPAALLGGASALATPLAPPLAAPLTTIDQSELSSQLGLGLAAAAQATPTGAAQATPPSPERALGSPGPSPSESLHEEEMEEFSPPPPPPPPLSPPPSPRPSPPPSPPPRPPPAPQAPQEAQEEEGSQRAAEAGVGVRALLPRHAGGHQGPEPQRHLRRGLQDRGLHVGLAGGGAETGVQAQDGGGQEGIPESSDRLQSHPDLPGLGRARPLPLPRPSPLPLPPARLLPSPSPRLPLPPRASPSPVHHQDRAARKARSRRRGLRIRTGGADRRAPPLPPPAAPAPAANGAAAPAPRARAPARPRPRAGPAPHARPSPAAHQDPAPPAHPAPPPPARARPAPPRAGGGAGGGQGGGAGGRGGAAAARGGVPPAGGAGGRVPSPRRPRLPSPALRPRRLRQRAGAQRRLGRGILQLRVPGAPLPGRFPGLARRPRIRRRLRQVRPRNSEIPGKFWGKFGEFWENLGEIKKFSAGFQSLDFFLFFYFSFQSFF